MIKKKELQSEDLPFIISDVLNNLSNFKKNIIIKSYELKHKKGLNPSAELEIDN